MLNDHPPSAMGEGVRPIHQIFVPLVAAFLLGAFATDLIYLETVSYLWETFSIWLLTAGLVIAPFAGIALLFDLVVRRSTFKPAWFRVIVCVVAALLSLINAFIHSRDGYTAVMPSGLTLDVIVGVLIVVLGCYGWNLSHRNRGTAAK